MLENVVAWVLNNYIGEYLENLNTDQLSIALLSGQVELENVPLKKTALRKFDLPLEVKSGVLGKLTLSIPITHIRSEPWTLKLSDVLIIVGPSSDQKYDVETSEQTEQKKKEQMLDEVEKRHRKQLLEVLGVRVATAEDQESWWGASLIATVVNNIQLILTNVHIRYEDGQTLPSGLTFACGVRIQKMTVQTTNYQWKPGFVEPQDGMNVFKKLDLKGFSLYWNSNQRLSLNINTVKDVQNLLAPEDLGSNSYIIEPCSVELRMEKNSSKLPLKGNPPVPRFKFWLRPEKIIVELTRRQMSELRALNREWSRFEHARLHRKWRPLSHIVGHAREWWQFACERVADETRRANTRRTWNYALTRARHLNAYARAYRRRLLMLINNPALREAHDQPKPGDHIRSVNGSEERTIMKQIERDEQYTFTELNLFRETVFRNLLGEKEKEMGISGERKKGEGIRTDTSHVEGFENIDSPIEDVPSQPDPPQSKGLYGWFSSFFSGEQPDTSDRGEPSFDFGNLDLPDLKNVPPAFKEIEKQVEEEILDVLHDSWDDSTVLRKDLLLAEVALRLDQLTLRFIDVKIDGTAEQRRVLAVDLMQVASRVEISPRTHTLAVSLSVHDMSIQRLVSTFKRHREESIQNVDVDESLIYSNSENTKVLLAVGRGTQSSDLSKPLFKMQYRRRSPRLTVRHTVEGSFRPISVMCDENALAGLGTLFQDDPDVLFATNDVRSIDELADVSSGLEASPSTTTISLESHVFVDLNIPSVCVVLRKRGWDEDGSPRVDTVVEPFACVNIDDVHLGIVSRETFMSALTLDVGHMDVQDMFENTTYPLLSTKKARDLKTVSTSCPDLASFAPGDSQLSSSLPANGFALCSAIGKERMVVDGKGSRKASSAVRAAHSEGRVEARIRCTFVDSRHPEFETRFSRKNCTIDVEMNEVEMGMNRRSWTAMMDFAGLLGGEEVEELLAAERVPAADNIIQDFEDSFVDVPATGEPFVLACSVHVRTLRVNMNYPGNGTRLGVIAFHDLDLLNSIHLRDVRDQIAVSLSFSGMRLSDRTPGYGALYDERLALTPDGGLTPCRAHLKLVKYPGDVDLTREWDLLVQMVVPQNMRLYYVHTHRYFCALMDFWMQFLELQDQISKQKKRHVAEGPKSRVKLDIDVQATTSIVLPQNQFSEEALVLDSSGLRVTNTFKRSSAVADIFRRNSVDKEFGFDANVDCLLDCMCAVLSEVQVYEARRVDRLFRREDKDSFCLAKDVFERFEFSVSRQPVFSDRFDLTTDVFRNLDGILARNVPDMTIITGVRNLTWRLTTDFYCLLRGFIQFNLADQLIPSPDTIPIELLNKPENSCEVGSVNKYATLSLRIWYEEVCLECLVPERPANGSREPLRTGVFFQRRYDPFARMLLGSARVSFDVFIDGQCELDLICESTHLTDTRTGPPGTSARNVHNVILSPRTPPSTPRGSTLMSEAHLMLRKDEPPVVTLVLVGARVLLAADWLLDAKEFILLNTEFMPPVDEPSCRTTAANISSSSCGVIARSLTATEAKQQTFSVKITLRESDLFLLEDQSAANSFGVLLFTTAVLNMNDANGYISANLEIQSMNMSWCLMDAIETTRSQCSNEFAIGIGLSVERKLEKAFNGLPMLMPLKHTVQVELSGLICKLSYRDARVLQLVLDGWLAHWTETQGKSVVPQLSGKPPAKPLEIGKVQLKTEHADLWLVDDVRGSCVPMVRLSLSSLSVERSLERIAASFAVNADYFNQRVFGWEPFVERWNILRLLVKQKDKIQCLEVLTETKSTLDINLTQDLIQQSMQWSARWPAIREEFDHEDFRTLCSTKTRSDHLPYLLKNETGSEVAFTTHVDDVLQARTEQRKAAVKWMSVREGGEQNFEFPTRLLFYSNGEREPARQLLVRVDGWDEISPVNVDACGTYFRVVKAMQSGMPNARLVIRVSMEKNGKKVVAIRASIEVHNGLPHPIRVHDEHGKELFCVEPSCSAPVPLRHAHSQFLVCPEGAWSTRDMAKVSWRGVRVPGEVLNQTVCLRAQRGENYWLCTSTRREHYPEHESLPGHSVYVVPPMTVLNLLPVDVEMTLQGGSYAVGAGSQMSITSVDITKELPLTISTDRLTSQRKCSINKSTIGESQRVRVRLLDPSRRPLDLYVDLRIGKGGAIAVVFWVPYWIVNKSGIPLIVKQETASTDAAGQMEEHERAKDKHPLMFSFAQDDCPNSCVVRVGDNFLQEPGYQPTYSSKFSLSPGVQALKMRLVHESLPTLYYNIGVEVRAGKGRYKDTQVVLLTSRYLLTNQSSITLSVCHHDLIDRPSEHVIVAPGCNLVWNENYEDTRMLCVRRADVKYWSCPFRIDRIGSFHVTMRDSDETPRFIRVEVILNSAVFCVTFTDDVYFPPPIQIDNRTDVPVLYQQYSENTTKQHLRTICKANSTVDYAWDDPSPRQKQLLLQVYENKSHVYDPAMQGVGPPLTYENHVYFQMSHSFKNASRSKKTDECELVLESMQKGKVMLNKQNRLDGNGGNQLWRFCEDGCIENIGMNGRTKRGVRMVLDVLEGTGYQLMLCERSDKRNKFQRWSFIADGHLCCGIAAMYVTARRTEVSMEKQERGGEVDDDGIAVSQKWRLQRQRPGSGTLDVECLHSGPTLVVRITDREHSRGGHFRSGSMPVISERPSLAQLARQEPGMEISITMRSGFGISLVNGQHEELIYARLGDIAAHARKSGSTYQMTGSVGVIQVDNQLLCADKWQVLYCHPDTSADEETPVPEGALPAGVPATARPALKLEMNCTPMKHYDAFDCFRLKLCEMAVQLDELLLWKLVQFAQSSDASKRVQPSALELPPNTELDRTDPLAARRCYFGTLDLEMGQIALSVVTVSKSGLPRDLRALKQLFNVKLVSFENATVNLPPFRQFHYFETSSFLLESLKKFYFAELQKQTVNIIFTLDAFGNPLGLVTDVKESFQGLIIEGDVSRFVAGLGYGVSNSVSKIASSLATGVGVFTFDEEHEAKRRHNMLRSHSTTSSTPLAHLYSGVKGLGVGVLGGMTAVVTNTIAENKRNGLFMGTFRGISTGVVDTVTKPIQGLFDLVEGTASAMKELAGPTGTRRAHVDSRIRHPRLCVNLFHLLPPYSSQMASAQMEMLRINGYNQKERLLDVEVSLEQVSIEEVVRQYVLISTKQCYVCRQVNGEHSSVIQRIAYKFVKSIQARPEMLNTLFSVEVIMEADDRKSKPIHVWCGRLEVAKRLADKMQRAKSEYDHNKRTLREEEA